MRRLHIVVITVAIQAVAQAAGGPALAQPASEDTASKQEQARKLFQDAEAHKRRGDEHTARGEQQEARSAYGLAAEAYSKAFELYEHAAFIYNLAQMRRLRGEFRQAIRAYETYLVLDPGGAQDAQARKWIAQLTLDLDAQESRRPVAETPEPGTSTDIRTAPDTPPEPLSGESGSGQDAGSGPVSAGAMDSPGVTATRPAHDADAGRGLRVAGMVTAAVGLAGLGLSVKFGLDARAADQALSEKPPGVPWGPDDRERIQSGEDAERNMIISLSLGGAAVITGGLLYTFGVAQSSSAGLAVRPTASADSVWVHLSGSF